MTWAIWPSLIRAGQWHLELNSLKLSYLHTLDNCVDDVEYDDEFNVHLTEIDTIS